MKIGQESEHLDILAFKDLTPEERKEFDYIKHTEFANFARYNGALYDLNDCEPVTDNIKALGWHGCYGTSYWSATVFKYVEDYSRVVLANVTW